MKQLRADNARLCRQIENMGAVPVTLSGKNPDSDTFIAPPQVNVQPARRPDSSYSTMSAPISTSGDMKPGFLPPINPGNQRGNGGPYSDVGPRTDQQQRPLPEQFPRSNDASDPTSYSQVSDGQSVHSQDSQPRRRPFALSPMAHFAHNNEDENTVVEEDNNSQVLDDPDDIDNEDNESQSSSASVDSETGDRVYSYNEEYWDESAGRFVTKSAAPAAVDQNAISPRAAAALGVNPVVAAYGNDPANVNGAAPVTVTRPEPC
mgnify:CR=1 FL=1